GGARTLERSETGTPAQAVHFELPPGKTTFRFSSYDKEGELLDRWAEEVTVPDLADGPGALATPRFLLARSAFELRALRTSADVTPAATRRLRKSDRLIVELEAYAAAGPPELTLVLLNQQGDSLVTLPFPEAENGKPRVEI